MTKFREVVISILMLLTAFIPAFAMTTGDQKPVKYILIHLDGVSSYYLQSELEAGNLPNIERVSNEGALIDYAITYFPSKTPTVISALRNATPIEETSLVGWSGENRDTGEIISEARTFIQMIWSKSRVSATNLIYGIPGLDPLAGIALGNLPDLLDEYRVLEFYWYAVDTYGHFFGEERYLKKLRVFDKHFGRLMNRIDDDVNVIVYADHGMIFNQGVDINKELNEEFGSMIRKASYPNLYVEDANRIDELALEIVKKTSIDYTFYRSNFNQITGYHQGGIVDIKKVNSKFCYNFEGTDPFEYYENGYIGECMSPDEWLALTYDKKYPVLPIKIFGFLSNPGSGDILTLLNKSKYSRSLYSSKGNHGGITSQEITIPIILKGPDLEFLYDRQTLWLQNLFDKIENADFDYKPSRDNHYLSGWQNPNTNANITQLSFSPAYRWGIGSEIAYTDLMFIDRYQFWGKFDLFRSYLARVWIGSGIDVNDGDFRPMAFIRHELRYRKLSARSTLSTAGNHRFALEYRFVEPLSFQVVNFNSFGLRLHF